MRVPDYVSHWTRTKGWIGRRTEAFASTRIYFHSTRARQQHSAGYVTSKDAYSTKLFAPHVVQMRSLRRVHDRFTFGAKVQIPPYIFSHKVCK